MENNKSAEIEYDVIDGKWWLFVNGKKYRLLTDNEAANVIWGSKGEKVNK